jgi:RNA polymerase sigma-70 factor (ECF subfamily)
MALDAVVARLVARGAIDEAATTLIEAVGPEILGYIRSVLRDDAEAGDAFSAFCERAWRGLPGFRGEASLRVWSYRIAWNAVLSLRKDAYRRRRERLETDVVSQLAGRIFATTAVQRERESSALERLKAQLTPEEQTLLTLRVDRQLSWSEVADVLAEEDGTRPGEDALRKRFERLKEKLAGSARDAGLME